MNKHSTITIIIAAAIAILAAPRPLRAQQDLPINAKITLDKTQVYERETIAFTLVITTTGIQFRQKLDLTNLPDAEKLDLFSDFETLPVKRTGSGHSITEIHRYRCRARAMTPGTIDIAPILRLSIMRRQRGFIGSFWREQAVRIQIPSLTLKINPLPPPPKNFSGAVGALNFHASIYPDDIALGDLITLTTRISGRGYTDNIKIPQMQNTPSLKTYAPKKISCDLNSTVYEQTIIPQTDNLKAIPKINFTYFDTRAKRYKTLTAGPFPIKYHPAGKVILDEFRPDDLPAATNTEKKAQQQSIKKSFTKTMTKARYQQATCSNDIPAHLAPSKASLTTFTIPENTEINILATHNNWLKIESEKQRGWIPADAIK